MTDYLQFPFILLLSALAAVKVTLQGRVCRGYIRNRQDSVLYNALFFSSVAICFLLFFPKCTPTSEILIYGVILGAMNSLFQIFYSIALTAGPVSITVLIVNFSVLIPTALSFFLFKEPLSPMMLIGIALLIASMILSSEKKGPEQKGSGKWLLLTVTAMLLTGSTACIQKVFNLTESAAIPNADVTLLLIIFITAALFSFVLYAFGALTGKKERSSFWFSKNVLLYAAVIGAVLCIHQKFFMYGIASIDGTFFFPAYYGTQSLVMSIIGILLFKDTLSVKQKIGVVCGVLSIVMINLKF